VLRRQIAEAGHELRNSWAYKVAMRSRVAPRKAVSLDVARNFFDGLGAPQWEHFCLWETDGPERLEHSALRTRQMPDGTNV
jgi:hypothetical protein